MSIQTKEVKRASPVATGDQKKREGTSDNSVPNTPKNVRPNNLLTRIFKVLCEQPYLAANTAFSFMTGYLVIAMLAVGGLGANFNRLLEGDPITIIQITVGVIALLSGTMGLTLIGMAVRQTARHESREASDQFVQSTLEKVVARLNGIEDHQSDVSDQLAVLVNERRNNWHPRASDVHVWNSFAPGTALITIFGLCATEIQSRRNANGDLVHTANLSLLEKAWLPRFVSHMSLSSITHISTEPCEDENCERFESGLLRTIASYRALQGLAQKSGLPIDLKKVRIVVSEPRSWLNGSVFVGTKRMHASDVSKHPFVLRYASMSLTAAKILNNKVDVSHSPEEFATYSAIANELECSASRTMSLEEAEATYGHLVPNLVNASNSPVKFTRHVEPEFDGDWLI